MLPLDRYTSPFCIVTLLAIPPLYKYKCKYPFLTITLLVTPFSNIYIEQLLLEIVMFSKDMLLDSKILSLAK